MGEEGFGGESKLHMASELLQVSEREREKEHLCYGQAFERANGDVSDEG